MGRDLYRRDDGGGVHGPVDIGPLQGYLSGLFLPVLVDPHRVRAAGVHHRAQGESDLLQRLPPGPAGKISGEGSRRQGPVQLQPEVSAQDVLQQLPGRFAGQHPRRVRVIVQHSDGVLAGDAPQPLPPVVVAVDVEHAYQTVPVIGGYRLLHLEHVVDVRLAVQGEVQGIYRHLVGDDADLLGRPDAAQLVPEEGPVHAEEDLLELRVPVRPAGGPEPQDDPVPRFHRLGAERLRPGGIEVLLFQEVRPPVPLHRHMGAVVPRSGVEGQEQTRGGVPAVKADGYLRRRLEPPVRSAHGFGPVGQRLTVQKLPGAVQDPGEGLQGGDGRPAAAEGQQGRVRVIRRAWGGDQRVLVRPGGDVPVDDLYAHDAGLRWGSIATKLTVRLSHRLSPPLASNSSSSPLAT